MTWSSHCSRSGWHGEHAAPEAVQAQDLHAQAQQRSAESELLDTKSTGQFLKYQQMLPCLRRPSRSSLGLPSGPSPPPSPPGGLDPDLTTIPPLFDFNLFNPERARGRNARLPVAVTSTLHSPSDAADDMVLQALLGDATSFAASSASQLASPASVERQQLQNSLAHQRIEQVAASAQELLRFQGPSFAHSAPLYSSNHFLSPPQNLPNSLGDVMSRERTLASLLQQPNQLVSSLEHYEAPGSGRPGRMHGQQQSRFQSPQSDSWIHKPVPTMRQAEFGSGSSPLPSPPALLNTQQRPYTPGNLQVSHILPITVLFVCLFARMLACSLACLFAYLLARMVASLVLACLPACLLAACCLMACLSSCLHAFLLALALLAGITCFLPCITFTPSSVPSRKSGRQYLGDLCMQSCLCAEPAALGYQSLGRPPH